jgi:hypothetical protein
MITVDTETVGLSGPAVLIQWAVDDGPINLHSVWTTPVKDTMTLIESICNQEVLGFNLTFDWFQLQKLYTMLSLCEDKDHDPKYLEMAEIEPRARDVNVCLKPRGALDLFLHAKKGPYQSLMEREDIKVKKVPNAIAYELAKELEKRVVLPDIYFARRSDKNAPKWKVEDIEDEPNFKNVTLRFAPTSALKALCIDAMKLNPEDVLYFTDVELPPKAYPEEVGYAPFALALAPNALKTGDWKGTWPEKINEHVIHWGYNELARKYAAKDIELTRGLYNHFGCPDFNDNDSLLACSIGAIRWRGYRVDIDKIKNLKNRALGAIVGVPTAPSAVKIYLTQVMDEVEAAVLEDTSKITLESIANGKEWEIDCESCHGAGCTKCNDTGIDKHPAAKRARIVLDARMSQKEVELYDKLILAGRFHASFKIIGTLSGRMSGGDGLNPQGIKASDEVRSCFPLSWDGQVLSGGDFAGFEVVLADAVYADPDLRNDLKSGKKIHALFGMHVFKDMTYDEIVESAGKENDVYSKAKRAVFAMLYGGEGHTLKERLGVDLETAEAAYQAFINKYKKVGLERRKVFDMFCSMRQPSGIGTEVVWHEPSDYIESIFGFRRYFTLENKICKTLFELANDPPKDWLQIKLKVIRRDRVQTAGGATRSALFGAAFAIQAQNMRSGANHVIQSSGAGLTKELQTRLWNLQPVGITPWVIMPCNIHDELNCPVLPERVPDVIKTVNTFVEDYKAQVPLLKMEWKETMADWSGKH